MVVVGSGVTGSKYLKRDYPITEGLTAGTEKQEGTRTHLVPEESFATKNKNEGLY